MSSGKAFPRVWLRLKARTLEYGYTMFAHKEPPAKDFEPWVPEKEHSALIAEKDLKIKELQEIRSMISDARDRWMKSCDEKNKEIENLRAALENLKKRFNQARDPKTGWVYDCRESGLLLAIEDDINIVLKLGRYKEALAGG